MKKSPPKSILILTGYLVLLMVLFRWYALNAESYYENLDSKPNEQAEFLLPENFHHIKVISKRTSNVQLIIQKKESECKMSGYNVTRIQTNRVVGDTLLITLLSDETYGTIQLEVPASMQSVTTHNIGLNLPSDIFDSELPIFITSTNDDEESNSHLSMEFNSERIPLVHFNLNRINISLLSDERANVSGSMKIEAHHSNIEFNYGWKGGLTTVEAKTDEESSLKAPATILRQLRLTSFE